VGAAITKGITYVIVEAAITEGLAYVTKGATVAKGFASVTKGAARTTTRRPASMSKGVVLRV